MRAFFIGHMIERALPVRQRPSIGDHPSIGVLAGREANRRRATVPIAVARFASNDGVTDMVGQGEGGLLAATPDRAVGPGAPLPAFRRVDAAQAKAPPVDLDRIAVDDGAWFGIEPEPHLEFAHVVDIADEP